jgi:hypothetical protein
LVDGIAVYHIPVFFHGEMDANSSCNANVPDELKGKGKKRAAPASATLSRDEKKQDIGSPSSSSPMDTTMPLHTPLAKRNNDDREFEGVSEEPASKKIEEGKCSCSSCKSSRYFSMSFLIASGPALPSNPKEKDLNKRLNLIEKNIDDSLQAPSEESKKEIIYLKRHLARLSDESFKHSCAHNSLEPLKWREGMPVFDGVCYPSLLMRLNVNLVVLILGVLLRSTKGYCWWLWSL